MKLTTKHHHIIIEPACSSNWCVCVWCKNACDSVNGYHAWIEYCEGKSTVKMNEKQNKQINKTVDTHQREKRQRQRRKNNRYITLWLLLYDIFLFHSHVFHFMCGVNSHTHTLFLPFSFFRLFFSSSSFTLFHRAVFIASRFRRRRHHRRTNIILSLTHNIYRLERRSELEHTLASLYTHTRYYYVCFLVEAFRFLV